MLGVRVMVAVAGTGMIKVSETVAVLPLPSFAVATAVIV